MFQAQVLKKFEMNFIALKIIRLLLNEKKEGKQTPLPSQGHGKKRPLLKVKEVWNQHPLHVASQSYENERVYEKIIMKK